MRNLFLTITILTITLTIQAQKNCPELASSQNIYAGLEVGPKGLKPTIIRFESAENGKSSFINLSRDLPTLNINTAKARTNAEMECTIAGIERYINVFRKEPYNISDDRIVIVINGVLKNKFAEKDSVLTYLKEKIKSQFGIPVVEMTKKDENEYKIRNLVVDEDYPFTYVNAFDIAPYNITGGSTDKNGQNISPFITDGSMGSITNYVKDEIIKQNLDIRLPKDRAVIAKMAETRFTQLHLSQMAFTTNAPEEVVVGGGPNFAMMAWYKAESFGEKRLNQFFLPYVYDYYLTLVSSVDKEDFFSNNRAKASNALTWRGKQRLAEAKAMYNDLELLVGAGIMKTIYDDMAKRGVKNFYFDDQMINSGMRYLLYKKYKGLLTASAN
jgi:3-polyprenyl-4-hydroxybenzoate decarboxylase